MWPLTVYDIHINEDEKIESESSAHTEHETMAWTSTMPKFCQTVWEWQTGITNCNSGGRIQMHRSKVGHDPHYI